MGNQTGRGREQERETETLRNLKEVLGIETSPSTQTGMGNGNC